MATLQGVTYSTANDTVGPLLGTGSRNLAIYSFTGNPVSDASLVNDMSGYGVNGLIGFGNTTWKTGGIYATKPTLLEPNGVLYVVVNRHHYMNMSAQEEFAQSRHQPVSEAYIIASEDKGVTWRNYHGARATDGAPPPYDGTGAFDGRFATPQFISYGADGEAPLRPVDNADAFIYAVSNRCLNGKVGCWNNGDGLYLGRVHREDIRNLDPREWEFYRGGDGSRNESWSHDVSEAKEIFAEPDHVSQTGAQYVPPLNRYVMMTWFYPRLRQDEHFMKTSIFRLLESPKPWGPWRVVRSITMDKQGFYNPMFSDVRWKDAGLTNNVVMGADWTGSGTYHPWFMDVRLNQAADKEPAPEIPRDGLICFYDMSPREGSTIKDRSGHGRDLSTSAVWDAEGLKLVSDMDTSASTTITEPLRDFTVFVLFRSPGVIFNSIHDRLVEYHFENGFSLNRDSNKPNSFGIDVFGSSQPNDVAPFGLYSNEFVDGAPHLLLATRTGSEIRLYRGSSLVATQQNACGSEIPAGDLILGARGHSRANATIAAVGLYKRAITDGERDELFSALEALARRRGWNIR
jgi:hypothetical protein